MPNPLLTPSLEGRALWVAVAACAIGVAGTTLLSRWLQDTRLAVVGGLILGALAAPLLARWAARRLNRHLRAVSTAISAMDDGDFAVGVEPAGIPEIDALITQLESVSDGLRDERSSLHQRELLLDTVVQSTPLAMALLDGRDRVVYSNTAACRLLAEGRKIAGLDWNDLVARQTEQAQRALAATSGGLFEIEDDRGERQVFLISTREFRLNARPHRLILIQKLTRELARQEVATWKKVIRVISHELNNSIAPISSMVHSSRTLVERGDKQRLNAALKSVSERVNHLAGFIDRYAAFARLPAPNRAEVPWPELVDALRQSWAFSVTGELPDRAPQIDRGQFEQALINLLKNAHESGSPQDAITLDVRDLGQEFLIEVRDEGPGMSDDTLSHALIPFYSTKREGSGIGLSLVREIIEAHGGRLSLHNRSPRGLTVRVHLP